MPLSVEEFRDLLRLLEERPEWRAELRRLLLTDALLTLPDLVRELVEAQQRTEARMGRLEEALAALAEAQGRTERQVEKMAEALQTLTVDVGELKGDTLKRCYRERAPAYFARLLRRAHLLSGDELNTLLDRAVAQRQLSEEDVDEILWADVIVRGRRRDDDSEVYLVVEVSWGVGPRHVERAAKRATLLAKAGVSTLPVVAGTWVTPDGQLAARDFKVWRVIDGRALAPEGPWI